MLAPAAGWSRVADICRQGSAYSMPKPHHPRRVLRRADRRCRPVCRNRCTAPRPDCSTVRPPPNGTRADRSRPFPVAWAGAGAVPGAVAVLSCRRCRRRWPIANSTSRPTGPRGAHSRGQAGHRPRAAESCICRLPARLSCSRFRPATGNRETDRRRPRAAESCICRLPARLSCSRFHPAAGNRGTDRRRRSEVAPGCTFRPAAGGHQHQPYSTFHPASADRGARRRRRSAVASGARIRRGVAVPAYTRRPPAGRRCHPCPAPDPPGTCNRRQFFHPPSAGD